MPLEGEAAQYHEIVARNCDLLVNGWSERVEYTVPVAYHRADCTPPSCECPVTNEKRVRNQRRPGLLAQLQNIREHKDTDRNPKAERGAPRVKTAGKPPGDLAGLFTLDEIVCDIYMTCDRVFSEAGRDRGYAALPATSVLIGLPQQVNYFGEARPDLARDLARATDRWVRQAKYTLRLTVSDAVFGDTVCGNCGGGLKIAWDNSSDVVCIGTLQDPPCGETYPMSEWITLYEKGRRAQ